MNGPRPLMEMAVRKRKTLLVRDFRDNEKFRYQSYYVNSNIMTAEFESHIRNLIRVTAKEGIAKCVFNGKSSFNFY